MSEPTGTPPLEPKRTTRKSTRVATTPGGTKSKKKETLQAETEDIFGENLETEEISESEEQTSETNSSSNDSSEKTEKKGSKKKAKLPKVKALLPFQGKTRANLWVEAIKSSFNVDLEEAYDKIATGQTMKVPTKLQKFDTDLYAALLESLLHSEATPEHKRYSSSRRSQATGLQFVAVG